MLVICVLLHEVKFLILNVFLLTEPLRY